MKINNINNIMFTANKKNNELGSKDAILMLRDPNAAVKFQQCQEFSKKADSVDSNPLVALGYKLYRTFNIIKGNYISNNADLNKPVDIVAWQIFSII